MSLLQMAKDLTVVQISTGLLSDSEVLPSLKQTFNVLQILQGNEVTQENGITDLPIVPFKEELTKIRWKSSIKQSRIICLECGDNFRILGHRHLAAHGLNGSTYKQKYGIPRDTPLSAKKATTKRREIAKAIRPWEKAPAYLKSQQSAIASQAMGKRKKAK
jgi:predicted transcriptional regulator